ncbi:MAG: DNA polymerase I [Chlamydiales bacterium]
MDRLFILDAINYLYRSYYAIRPMTNSAGKSTHALYGFIRSVQKIIKDFSPTHLVCVFDGKNNTSSREKIYPEYKAQRDGMPNDLGQQLQEALFFCEYAGIPYLSIDDVEADDIIASIAKWAERKEFDVFLCSSDKDLCQLISPHIKMIHIHKENLIVDGEKIIEMYGVKPSQMIDYLALVGDTSDNIPGVAGFGPKTAALLLQQFNDLQTILAKTNEIASPRQRELLRIHKKDALMSQKLVRLYTNIPFPKKASFFLLKPPDKEKLLEFYQSMNFSSLLKNFLQHPNSAPAKKDSIKSTYILIDNLKTLDALLQSLVQKKSIAIKTITTGPNPFRDSLLGIAISAEKGKAFYIPIQQEAAESIILNRVKSLLEDKNIQFFGHDIKYDMHVLARYHITVSTISFDTMIASYLLQPQKNRHSLAILLLDQFGIVHSSSKEFLAMQKQSDSANKIASYGCQSVDYIFRAKNILLKQLKERKLFTLFTCMEIPLIPVLFLMESHGIYVDLKKLEQLSDEVRKNLHILMEKIYTSTGERFNLNSPKQLREILFKKIPLKMTKRGKKTGELSTSAEVLESIQHEVPLAADILEYRTLEKLRSTYLDVLPHQLDPDTHRIHCTFNQSVTATGRLSCQDPNLQNIPIRSKIGRKIRGVFRPQRPGWSFLSADYSQIELRILAHLSQDPNLIHAFLTGQDIHNFTASQIFEVPLEKVTKSMRDRAKGVNFGLIYGQGATGLSKQLKISIPEAKDFIAKYFLQYPKIAIYLESLKQQARESHIAYTLMGRQRPIPEIENKNFMVQSSAERLAINTPFQGLGADFIKMAMIEIDNQLRRYQGLGLLILQIHDELLFEIADSVISELEPIIKSTMESVYSLSVPLIVDIDIGKNWEECYH